MNKEITRLRKESLKMHEHVEITDLALAEQMKHSGQLHDDQRQVLHAIGAGQTSLEVLLFCHCCIDVLRLTCGIAEPL